MPETKTIGVSAETLEDFNHLKRKVAVRAQADVTQDDLASALLENADIDRLKESVTARGDTE